MRLLVIVVIELMKKLGIYLEIQYIYQILEL